MPLNFEEYSSKLSSHLLELKFDSMFCGVEKHLPVIAKDLDNLVSLAPRLKIKDEDFQAIFEFGRHKKRIELLRLWKRQTGDDATYCNLLEACVTTYNAEAADTIVKLLTEYNNQVVSKSEEVSAKALGMPLFSKDDVQSPDEGLPEDRDLNNFSEEVEIILQTVLEHEYKAALKVMEPPSSKFEKAVRFKGQVLGLLASYKTVLIQTDSGTDVRDGVMSALQHFPNAKYILSVGVCYSFKKKIKIGDVIVSKKITRAKLQFKHGGFRNVGEKIKVADSLKKIFCNDNTLFDFDVSKSRKSEVHIGHYLSFPALMDSASDRDKLQKAVPGVIGGEKEGGTLLKIREESTNNIEGIILIKGVVDYGEGRTLANEDWYFTASLAALNYVKMKLLTYRSAENHSSRVSESIFDLETNIRTSSQPILNFFSAKKPTSGLEIEKPIFSKDKQEKEYKKKQPAPSPSCKEREKLCELRKFTNQIHIILLTACQNEYQAVVTEMEPPNSFEFPVKFPTPGIVVGKLGRNQVALIQTNLSAAAIESIEEAIDRLPNAEFIICVGGCQAFNKAVHKFGDTIVSDEIISQGQAINVGKTLSDLFCSDLTLRDDFSVSDNGRCSKVCKGKYGSHQKEAICRDMLMDGDMPHYLTQKIQKKEILGVIMIKGVTGYSEDSMERWQFTATKAAINYTKKKLDYYNPSLDESIPNDPDIDVKYLVERGLGSGVDATTLNPRKNRHMCIREVIEGARKNYEQKVEAERTYDEWNAFNRKSFEASITAEIKPSPAPVKIFGASSFNKSSSDYQTAIGYKRITRSVEFNSELAETEENKFINDLCKELQYKHPRISSSQRVDAASVENYLRNNKEKHKSFISSVYKFIEEKKVTHYISAVDMGAAEYHKSTIKLNERNGEVSAGIDPGQAASLKAAIKSSNEKGTYSTHSYKIGGNIDEVRIGKDEVIEYKLLPVHSLIHRQHENFRDVFGKAIKLYLEKDSGPYWIMCGSDSSYLQCENEQLKKVKSVNNASEFRIFEGVDSKSFSIGYRSTVNRPYQYITSERFMSSDVRLSCNGSRVFFHLDHSNIKPEERPSVAMWRANFFSLQLNQNMNFKRSYLGWRKSDGLLSMKKHRRSEVFKLVNVPILGGAGYDESAVNGSRNEAQDHYQATIQGTSMSSSEILNVDVEVH